MSGGNFPEGYFSGGLFFLGGIFPGGNFPGSNFLGGFSPGAFFPNTNKADVEKSICNLNSSKVGTFKNIPAMSQSDF